MRETVKLYLSTLKLSFALSFQASKFIMIFRLLTLVAGAVIPIINVCAMKKIIDSLTSIGYANAVYWLVVLGVCQILSAVIGKTTNYLSGIHSDRISLLISKDIISKVNELDISYFDNPQLYNELINVTGDIKAIPSLIWQVLSSVQITIKIFSSIIILTRYIPISPWILILSCLPIFIIDKKYAMKMYEWNRSSSSEARKMGYSYDTLTSKYFSTDIRLHDLKDYLYRKYEQQWKTWNEKKYAILSKQFWASFLAMFLPNITTLVFAALILDGILNGKFTIGDFSYYISIMGQLTVSVSGIISITSEILNQKAKIEYYNKFKSWKSNLGDDGTITIKSIQSIVFDNVSFTYPYTQKQVLSNVSFCIKKGQKVGIIGKNGSGKTTIIKLLLRLYKPTSGRILVNGIDIQEYKIRSYYKLVSGFMQEYVNYCFELKENIKTADIERISSDNDILEACKKSDAYSFISTWENGMREYLTKSFDASGKELSGGQWQKIALSRFFYRNAELRIMDEPSSSIDIESEKKIFDNVLHSNKKNTIIIISHRLSNIKDMDMIIVIEDGKIVEKGKHESLMERKGTYYTLFNIQKEKFA